MHQICVENGGVFTVLAGPAGTLGTLLAIAAQSLITMCHTAAAMALILIGVLCVINWIHNVIRITWQYLPND